MHGFSLLEHGEMFSLEDGTHGDDSLHGGDSLYGSPPNGALLGTSLDPVCCEQSLRLSALGRVHTS